MSRSVKNNFVFAISPPLGQPDRIVEEAMSDEGDLRKRILRTCTPFKSQDEE
jgi:hypothetical protein